VDLTVTKRRHFPGYLFPVAPVVANFIQGLFSLNERVVLLGQWKHGFYCLSPVGATNVGSITLSTEIDLRTNLREHKSRRLRGTFFEKDYTPTVSFKKGEEVGMFHLGSTVVMVFESPEFEFNLKVGQKVKLGQTIGRVKGEDEDVVFKSQEPKH